MGNKELNRIKAVLNEKHLTEGWLAEQLGMQLCTISLWCTNTKQPSIERLMKISKILDVSFVDLIIIPDDL